MQKGRASMVPGRPVYLGPHRLQLSEKRRGRDHSEKNLMLWSRMRCLERQTGEQAESAMQKQAADLALEKRDIHRKDVRYLFAGDLLGQLIATSFGTVDLDIPLFGLYGACSTIGEAIGLGSMCVGAGDADCVLALASSHYATGQEAVSFSAWIWESETAECLVDCDRMWSSRALIEASIVWNGSQDCRHHDRKTCRYGNP